MATNIQFSDLTNATTPTDGTGYFDKLLSTVNIHINDQYNQGRLTGTDYAKVYLGSIQSAISQSLEFLLKEKLIEAQTDGANKDNLLKDAQLAKLRNEEEAELEKQWGYNVTRDTDGRLILGNSTGNGIIDKQGAELDKNVDVTERTTVLKEAESIKQQALLDKDLDIKTYDNDTLQVDTHNTNLKQLDSIVKDIDVKERGMVIQESELADKLSTSAKQRILLDEEKETSDKQQLLLDVQKDSETYKKDTLLVDEHNTNLKKLDSITKDIDIKERSTVVQESELADKLITAEKQRIQLDVETKLAEQKVVGRKQSAVTAE